jgi:hypothetical protein
MFDTDLTISDADMKIEFNEFSNYLGVVIRFNTDLFERKTVERMGERLAALLNYVISNPDTRLNDIPIAFEPQLEESAAAVESSFGFSF